jgi:hypothetical protein
MLDVDGDQDGQGRGRREGHGAAVVSGASRSGAMRAGGGWSPVF